MPQPTSLVSEFIENSKKSIRYAETPWFTLFIMISVREILMRISGRKIAMISEQCRLSLSNLSNHSHLIVNETDSIREMLNGLLDQIDNTLLQKMNETIRVLTAFAAIFLPLSLI